MRTALGVGERSRFLRRIDAERDRPPPAPLRSLALSGVRRLALSSTSRSLLVRRVRSLDRV